MTANRRSEAGFTLIEALVATAIMVIVTGAVFSVLNPSSGLFQSQPEMSDMQQRLRVGVDQLKHDLMNAGAGSYSGLSPAAAGAGLNIAAQQVGSLINYFAPVMPFRQGWDTTIDDPVGTFKSDAITIIYVPSTGAQTTVKADMTNASSKVYVNAESGCPQVSGNVVDPLCGFKAAPDPSTKAAIYDGTGAFDTFVVTARDEATNSLDLQHTQQGTLSKAYQGTDSVHFTRVAEISYHVYYLNATTKQLMHYDGLSTATPVLDNVVGLNFEYYGDPQAPVRLKPDSATDRTATYGPTPPFTTVTQAPWGAGENCTWTSTATKLPALAATNGLVKLTASQLTDGPWCPDAVNANRYDADLFRIRKIRVTLRLQSGNAALRGAVTNGADALFTNGGTATNKARTVPDQAVRFDVTPRNMNLGR